MSIAAVERETGLPKDTLRVWERRYGFPRPERDSRGERLYPEDQIARLRTVKRLMDRGMRPGRLLALDADALMALAEQSSGDAPPRSALHDLALFLLKTHQAGELRRELVQVLMRDGKWKYIRMFDGRAPYDESDVDFSNRQPDFEMLFDLEADPQEMNNLAKSDDHRDVLATLRRKCAAHSQSLNEQRRVFKDTVQIQKR